MINGLEGLSDEDRRRVTQANELASLVAVVAHTAEAAGIPWFIEQPADRGDKTSDAYWDGLQDPPHMFNMPFFKVLRDAVKPTVVTFPQCALGARVQKFTSIMGNGGSADLLQVLDELRCTHQHHDEVVKGMDERGQMRSAAAARYPPRMAQAIAKLMQSAGGRARGGAAAPRSDRRHAGPQ